MFTINFNFNNATTTNAAKAKATTTIITPATTTKWNEPEGFKITGRDERVHSKSFSMGKMGWMQTIEDPETGIELESPYFVGMNADCIRFNLLQSLETFRRNLSMEERWAIAFDSSLIIPDMNLGDSTWRFIRYMKLMDQANPKVAEIRNIWNRFIMNANQAVKESREKIDIYKDKIDRLESRINELEAQMNK